MAKALCPRPLHDAVKQWRLAGTLTFVRQTVAALHQANFPSPLANPLSAFLLLTEIQENLAGASALWELYQRWQQAHSTPYVPPPPSSPAPELVLSSR
ncbi:MAG: hypothetical protein HC895_10765 [Leptolyngbyaceae cyanobacterium SM1_3_5]|nr:hypothetical protein [Leptolyngbyaceae cyanobacterium SM1_3_5]